MSEPRLHVVFSPSAAGTLRQALLQTASPDEVLCPFDDFSFGPIATDDAEARIAWVENELGYTGWREATEPSATLLAALDGSTAAIAAWFTRRQALSYAGFLWWLSHMGNRPVSVIETEDPAMMNGDEIVGHLDRAEPLLTERRARFQARWEQLKIEDAPLRVIEGEELVSGRIDRFDADLLRHATPEWQKMARIVGNLFAEFRQAGLYQTGDLVLSARLAHLAETGRLEWRGDLSLMRGCELRLRSS